jgi:phospholipid/cholesterol/gamma-HCH transport system substrate-binding protein
MAGKQSNFMIGIFVTAGLVMAIVAIIWLGASQYFQRGEFFVTYFDESVQGLSVDSHVKYRGVNVGTVRTIQVAPDNRLVEVVMKIDMRGGDEKERSAKLKSAGLTGIVYIELDRMTDEEGDMSPQLGFPAEYPVIPSRPSDAKYILSMVDRIVTEVNKIDIKAIFKEIQNIAGGIDQLVNGPKMKHILANLESATARLDHALRQVDNLTADGKLDDVFNEARGTITDTRALIGKIREDFEQLQLAGTMEKTNRIVSGVDQSVREISQDLRMTTDNLQRASENLDILMDKLRDDPSDLLFSRPPPVSGRER